MSGMLSALLVDWDALSATVNDSNFHYAAAFWEGTCRWVFDMPLPETLRSSRALAEAAEVYDEIRDVLPRAHRDACDALIYGILGQPDGSRRTDLPAVTARDPETLAALLSPRTVAIFRDTAARFPYEVLAAAFEARCTGPGYHRGWMETFDDFREFVQSWHAVLRPAAERGLGIVLSTA